MNFDFVSRSPREQFLADEGQFVPAGILKGKFVAPTERAAIDDERVAAILIADDEIITPRPELLFHHVAHVGFELSLLSKNASNCAVGGVAFIHRADER